MCMVLQDPVYARHYVMPTLESAAKDASRDVAEAQQQQQGAVVGAAAAAVAAAATASKDTDTRGLKRSAADGQRPGGQSQVAGGRGGWVRERKRWREGVVCRRRGGPSEQSHMGISSWRPG